ncbi:MAG: hypothetical protein JOZ41_19040 [Chloroflexi bacterium]|nr:hypothetical protein [Chloroflexota bacterium]
MGAERGREQTYQWMLRALGAFLDEEPSCRISLAEVPDGFLVRMQRALHKLEPKVLHFNRSTLVEQLEQQIQQRKALLTRTHHQGLWAHFPNGHQDFLRALGYELDQASARGILIDELEDGVVVTYSYPGPETEQWRKRMVVLGISEIEEILNAAFERRHNRPAVSKS